ncbi:SDR family oxidoreductase [Ahrensia marina]|uniref:Oxidoreductase n=1 Tax=Ahrensia marina TaxID=1514904 RepID=A0A0M9GL61_9HYPH|nr:SDR family oxidoreductase [Ahrensia marina]KPB00039.1 oxidoreductase [Ahrensia marina]
MPHTTQKVIAITGASSGIGLATAKLLAQSGAKLVIGARRADRIDAAAEGLRRDGADVISCSLDVTDRASVSAFVSQAVERFGQLDVLVNNAGIAPISALDDLNVDEWDAMIDVNLRGPLYGIAAALPIFRQQGSGHVINIVSTAGLVLAPHMAVYAATKNALRTIGEGLRLESGPDLRVTNVSPGFVQTEFASSIADETVRSAIEKRMGEIGLSADSIAQTVAFAINQPSDVEVGDIVIRPAAQN